MTVRLREHTEDIPDLAALFLDELGDPGAMGRIDKPARDRLFRHDWPSFGATASLVEPPAATLALAR